jgi:hypothetical protein
LLNPDYHLVVAFPTLCKVYAIPVAIPISSALKRVYKLVRLCLKKDLKRCYWTVTTEQKTLSVFLDKELIITAFWRSDIFFRNARNWQSLLNIDYILWILE